jgi:hypothetical protein
MKRRLLSASQVLALSLVVAALTFGASQAFASTGASSNGFSCSPASIGTCTSQEDCQSQCETAYPNQDVTGDCRFGCCFCLL